MIATQFIEQGYPVTMVLKHVGLSRSSYYYKPRSTRAKRGRRASAYTMTFSGKRVPNNQVVRDIIELLPVTQGCFSYLEFDIKYVWVNGERTNILVLTAIDVESRWVLGQTMGKGISKHDISGLFEQIFTYYPMPKQVWVRNDNGSQMVSEHVRSFFAKNDVVQEFTKPATPEQNAHIESYHSIVERVICQRFEFESLTQAYDTFQRWLHFYNHKRIHSGIEYTSPAKYLTKFEYQPKLLPIIHITKS